MRHAARSLARAAHALGGATQLQADSACRWAHAAAASARRFDIQPSLRPGLGVVTWLLQSNLSPAERRALADELDPRPVVRPAAVAAPPPAAPQVVVKVVEKLVPAAPPVEHPVLGTLLHDFGYKRVYAMPASQLTDPRIVPVWNQQRSFRLERAEAIARAKAKDGLTGMPGVVTLYELGDGNFRAIIDGQHRVGALRLLLRDGSGGQSSSSSSQWSRVLVEVFPLRNEREAEHLFCEINSAQPVQMVDLPASSGGADAADKAVLEAGVGLLAAQYGDAMFKPSVQCKPPHVNVDRLRDMLFQHDVLAAHGLRTAQQLHAWLLDRNAAMGALAENAWAARRPAKRSASLDGAFAKALAKAREHNFFLGMDWRWLDDA